MTARNPGDKRGEAEHELALLRRVEAGDRDAFRQLFVRYYGRLSRFLGSLTGDVQLVEELTDDTMLVVWRKAGQFGARSQLSTWIFGIAYHLARKALASRSQRAYEGDLSTAEMTWGASGGPTAQQNELQDLLEIALRALEPELRALLELAYFMGYSCTEIATIVGCPVNTVKTRLFHARARLRVLVPALAARPAASFGQMLE